MTGLPNTSGIVDYIQSLDRPHFGLIVVELQDLRKRIAVLGKDFTDTLIQDAASRLMAEMDGECVLSRISESELMLAFLWPAR